MKPMTMAQWYREKGSHHWDFIDEHLRARFEVKIWSDNHTIYLRCHQLLAQKKEMVFPYEDGFLFFFSYRNRRTTGGRKKSLLGQFGKSWSALSRFLSRNVNAGYLVDMRLIHRIWERNGAHHWKKDLFNEHDEVRLPRRDLKQITHDMRGELKKLGFSREEIPQWLPPNENRSLPRIIETVFNGRRVSFPLFVIAPNGFKKRFFRRLNGTVKRD
jgi:hypothetical protein